MLKQLTRNPNPGSAGSGIMPSVEEEDERGESRPRRRILVIEEVPNETLDLLRVRFYQSHACSGNFVLPPNFESLIQTQGIILVSLENELVKDGFPREIIASKRDDIITSVFYDQGRPPTRETLYQYHKEISMDIRTSHPYKGIYQSADFRMKIFHDKNPF